MSFKTTYVLFGLLLGLVLVLVLTQMFGTKPGEDTYIMPDLQAAKLKPSQIDTVEIERFGADPPKLVFVRVGDEEWKMTQPAELRVDEGIVNRLLYQLMNGRREDKARVDLSPNLSLHGLEPPKARITLKKKDGGDWSVNLGNKSPGSDASAVVYATSSAKPREPMGIKYSAIDLAFKNVNDFRSKDLLTHSALNVTSIKLQDPKGEELSVEKGTEGKWHFVKPEFGDADYEGEPAGLSPQPAGQKKITGVRDLAEAVEHIRIGDDKDFFTDHATDLAQYGLEADKPETFRVEVKRQPGGLLGGDATKQTRTATLLVGKKADDKGEKYYARLADEPHVVVTIPKASLEPLQKTLADPSVLRNRDLLTLDKSKVDAIDGQSRDRGAFQLRKIDGQWKLVDGQKLLEVESNEVDKLLDALVVRRQVKEFPPASAKDADLGLDKPSAAISLWVDGIQKEDPKEGVARTAAGLPKLKSQTPTAKLAFGKEDKDEVYVQREVDKQTSRMALPAVLLSKVAVGKLHFLARNLVELKDREKVTKIVITRGMDVVTLQKDKNEWKLDQPANLAGRLADRAKVDTVLLELENLYPTKYVTDTPTDSDLARFGLTDTPVKIALTLDKGDKKTEEKSYLFGQEDDTKTGIYAKQGDSSLIFLVGPEVVKRLPKDFVDTTVARFDLNKVQRIKLTGWQKISGTPDMLELERKGKDSWAAVNPPMFAVDSKKVEEFVSNLHDLKALRFEVYKTGVLAPHELEVGRGALEIEIALEGDKEPLVLTVGAFKEADKAYYAKSSRLPGDVFLLPEGLFKEVMKGRGYFSSRPAS